MNISKLFEAVYKVKLYNLTANEHKINVGDDTVNVNIEFKTRATACMYCNQLASLISRHYNDSFYISTSYLFGDSVQSIKRYYESIKELNKNVMKASRAPEIFDCEHGQRGKERPCRLTKAFRDEKIIDNHSSFHYKYIFNPREPFNDLKIADGLKKLNESLDNLINQNLLHPDDKIDS